MMKCTKCNETKSNANFRKMANGKRSKVCSACADCWRQTAEGSIQTKLNAHCQRTNDPYLPAKRYIKTLEAFGNACANCGSKNGLHIDHMVPVAKGGKTVVENLIPLCQTCNLQKSDCDCGKFFSNTKLNEIQNILSRRLEK